MPASIWQDEDVRKIYTEGDGGQPDIAFVLLDGEPEQRLLRFVRADAQASERSPAPQLLEAIHAGVEFVETMPDDELCAVAFKKFVVFQTGHNVRILWEQFRAPQTAMFADWVVSTISRRKWRPDGNVSALGNMFSVVGTVALEAGGGMRTQPDGQFVSPNGDDARRALGLPTLQPSASPPGQRPPADAKKRRWWRR